VVPGNPKQCGIKNKSFVNLEFKSKRKIHPMPFGTGYTEYHAEIVFLGPFGEENDMGCKPFVKLHVA